MSEVMALSDNVPSDDAKMNSDDAAAASAVEADAAPTESPPEPEEPPSEDKPAEDSTKQAVDEPDSKQELDKEPVIEDDKPVIEDDKPDVKDVTAEVKDDVPDVKDEKPMDNVKDESGLAVLKNELAEKHNAAGDGQDMEVDNGTDERRGLKRRASTAFVDDGIGDFIGFETADTSDLSGYNRVLERLEAEVSAATKDFKPLRNVMATPSAPVRASKRPRQDTDGSRPSSALSSRSDGDGVVSTDAVSSPLSRGGRRATSEMSSPLLRVPLERGWKRELVYRAALDAHSRRNADIYYYTPLGKKLRSTREVAEQLSGTGLTLENFSFFKEPLGVDDPEKEIIRDARLMSGRRGESPVAAPAEGKRTPKPKPAKGASPEPAPKSPPAKIRVKSMGSRLSNSGPASTPATPTAKAKKPAADNNNSAAWKKPRPPPAPVAPVAAPVTAPAAPVPAPVAPVTVTALVPPAPPPPLQSRPVVHSSPEQDRPPARQIIQPCSLTCGRGVPSLACAACLCLYHPACIQHYGPVPQPFYCRNCRKSTSPTVEPPPLTHKSGVTPANMASLPAPVPRRVPAPAPLPVPKPVPVPKEKRVLLRMKAASGGPAGGRVWAVAGGGPATTRLPHSLPQSLVRLNGRRFILVPHHKLPAGPADE